jgi:hypothetical protein
VVFSPDDRYCVQLNTDADFFQDVDNDTFSAALLRLFQQDRKFQVPFSGK